MAVPRLLLALVASLCFVAVNGGVLCAQIFNASASPTGGKVQQASGNFETKPASGGILPTTWLGLPMPKMTMPKITMPKISMPKWPSSHNGETSGPSPFAPLTAGFHKISSGTKKAWHGVKEMFTFGSDQSGSLPQSRATSQPKPSFWRRMFGSEPKEDGPQTVAEWMAQPRLDP